MTLIEYPDREMMMIRVADLLASQLKNDVMVNGAASFAVPGGSTPAPVFEALSAVDLDWAKVTVLPGDERWVPEDHAASNARLIRKHLLQGRAAAAQLLPFYDGSDDGVGAVDTLTQALRLHLPLSVCLLGMGGDMHTASLFPGQAPLRPEHRHSDALLHYVPMPGLDPKLPRMTLSVQAINASLEKHVLITGTDKKLALQEAQRLNDPFQAPISAVLSGATVHWAA